jgi:hypothetical protein
MTEYKEIRTTRQEPGRELRILTFKVTQLVWLVFIILEVLIGLRIGLKLLGANPGSLFASLLYAVTNLFLFPFSGLIHDLTFGNMVLEISSFIAMVVYILIGWAIERIIYLIFYWPGSSIRNRQTVVTGRTPTSTVVEETTEHTVRK